MPAALRDDPAFTERGLQLADVLGVGGQSVVYRARDARHGRDVAIKILRAGDNTGVASQRFAQELRVAGGLRHPHILPLFDSGTLRDGRVFAVMPVAHGRPLRAMIAEGPLSVADAVRLAHEVAEALSYLHERGWVHRDVKPENILVESGHAALTDFGIAAPMNSRSPRSTPEQVARLWGEGALGGPRLTLTGTTVGTLAYMSSESLLGDAPVDARTDVYALGLVLYEMLAGELPFAANTPTTLIAERLAKPLPSVGVRRSDIPAELESAIARATAVDPAKRFATAGEFDAALRDIPMRDRRERVALPFPERDRRVAVLAIVLLAAIGGAIGILRARRAVALDPQRIVVADLANQTGDRALDRLGPLAGDLITSALSERTTLDVVNATVALGSRQGPLPPTNDSSLARDTRALVVGARAGLVVTGAYYREAGVLRLLAEVTDTRGGRVLGAVGPIVADPRTAEQALLSIADSVVAIVRRRHAPPES